MRTLQKLMKCGNGTHITIPRPALFYLGWLPGEQVIFELLEDKSIRVRKPCEEDFRVNGVPKLNLASDLPAAK